MENLEQDHLNSMDLEIDADVRQQFSDAGKWTKFVSIVMFIFCGFILLFGVIGGAAMMTIFQSMEKSFGMLGEFGGGIFIVFIVIIAAAIAIVYYFLFNFSRKMKVALISESIQDFNTGLKSLKTYFIITGVFAILSLLSAVFNLFNTL